MSLNLCFIQSLYSHQKTFSRGGVSPEFCKQNSFQATRKTLFSKSFALNLKILAVAVGLGEFFKFFRMLANLAFVHSEKFKIYLIAHPNANLPKVQI